MTDRQLAFARFYAADPLGNVTQAALKAGCATELIASRTGSRWLKKVEVQSEIARLRTQTEQKLDISAEKVISQIAKIAFADVRKLFNEDGSLREIKDLDDETAAAVAGIEHEKLFEHFGKGQAKHVGTTVKIKRADALRALELLGRWHKLKLFQENINVTGLEGLALAVSKARQRVMEKR